MKCRVYFLFLTLLISGCATTANLTAEDVRNYSEESSRVITLLSSLEKIERLCDRNFGELWLARNKGIYNKAIKARDLAFKKLRTEEGEIALQNIKDMHTMKLNKHSDKFISQIMELPLEKRESMCEWFSQDILSGRRDIINAHPYTYNFLSNKIK